MPTLVPEPHRQRRTAESFGLDPQRYDRARPRYPAALVRGILDAIPGSDLLDVGCGTGIEARQFRDAGATVLGVDPDARMAAFARDTGIPVEVATFEEWDPAGRVFDAVVAGQSWHWVDPDAGTVKAAQVLRPGGVLAVFAHVFDAPPSVTAAATAAYRRVAPSALPDPMPAGRTPLQVYESGFDQVADRIRRSGRFAEPQRWRFDEPRTYTRDTWLDHLPTTGLLTTLPADRLAEVLEQVGAAVDAIGGGFTVVGTTLAVVATVGAAQVDGPVSGTGPPT